MTDSPFAPTLTRQSFFQTLGGTEALRRLDDGLGAREPFLLVTGDPGTGKSALANEAIARWGARATAAYVAFPSLTATELLEEILRRFGVEPPEGAGQRKLVACLESALAEIAGRGQVAIIVVDDAHHLSPELLEELRLLVSAAQQARRPLEVLLVGLPALEATLDDPALVSVRQRVSVRAKLDPLSAVETRRYIRHRASPAGDDRSNPFPRKTCAEIATLSRGVPRQINALAAEALRLARASGRSLVEPGHVRDAVAALSGVLPKSNAEDTADDGPEEVPAPTRAQPPVPKAAAPAAPPAPAEPPRAPERAKAPEQVEAPTVRPAEPRVTFAVTAPKRVDAGVEPVEAAATPAHVPPTRHDSREWVARFVGDQGPIQISSLASPRSSWTPERFEAAEAIAQDASATPPTPPGPADRGFPLSLPWRAERLQLAVTAGLVAIGIITAVVLGLRATGNARKAADGTTASVALNGGDTSSARASKAGSRASRTAVVAGASDRASDASPIPRGPYTLDAGVRLDLQTALDERNRIQALTGIEGWVAPAAAPGDQEYRIVLGIFRSYARARAAANMLMRSRTLSHVTVVSMPARSTRQ